MARTAPRLTAALRIPGKRDQTTPARSGPRLPAALRPSPKRAKRTGPSPAPHALPLPVRLLAMLVAFGCMVAFAVVLARLTLQPSPASVPLTHSNLHPGRSLHAYLVQGRPADTVKQLGGNVLLGVPFGVLVPVLAPRARRMLPVLALTALVMLMVELAQGALVTGRAFDIDDVILNTAGALLGWLLLGRRLGRGVHRRVAEPSAG